ncbi:hypothetical protein [Paenibacillus sp. NRS-1760]|uniref:hypothetical protein n=1 Tax=Paenibacillus sp. NRS-1760 TaxID=3233902 RepID=UPI003D2A82CD
MTIIKVVLYDEASPGEYSDEGDYMTDCITIPKDTFERVLRSIEHYCSNSCPMFMNACLHFECPLFAIEHVLTLEHEYDSREEPLCWYVINFNTCNDIAIVYTNNENAEKMAEGSGNPYDLHVFGTLEAAYEEMNNLMDKKIKKIE